MMFMIFKTIKKKVKGNIFCFLMILFLCITNLIAQQTNNLEVIWVKTGPDSVIAFGRCIASGDVNGDGFSDIIVIGDSVIENPPVTDSCFRGKCWIFYGGPCLDTIPDVQLLNTQRRIFTSLHLSDINGDGFSDVIIGTWANNPDEVLIFLGGNPMDSTPDYRIRCYRVGDEFGCSVSSGDVNGDRYSDLIVGAYGTYVTPIGDLAGRVYIYIGGPNFDTIPDVILNGGHNNDPEAFGRTLSGLGDVNNDGFFDIIVGAMNYGGDRGRIYVYYGGNPMDSIYDISMIGEGAGHSIGEFGVDLIRNQQTYDYAITSTPILGGGRGKVYVLFGGNPMDSIPDVCMVGRTSLSKLGMSISTAGFVSGLLSEGIIAGAPIEYSQKGTAYFWQGGVSIDSVPEAWISGVIQYDGIGWHVASAGDVDGDGIDEIMVCNSASPIEPSRKKVWVCKYTGVGIEEVRGRRQEARNLKIYPNPVRSVLRVSCPWSVKEMKIYDVTGKIVKTFDKVDSRQNTEYREIRWDLRNENNRKVANGIYFVELIAEQENEKIREIRKIVITK